MDLTAIPGIGPAYRDRLRQAGISDAAALARVPDLSSLAEWTGIAPTRLAGFQAEALRLTDRAAARGDDEDGGIVLDAPPRAPRGRPLVALRRAGIRVVAAVGAFGAAMRPSQKKTT